MSDAVPSLFLVGMKQEEATTEEEYVLRSHEVPTSFRKNRPGCRLIPQSEHESDNSESDCVSSGDEWQPPLCPTSPNLSSESRTPLLPPSAASTLPTDHLNTTHSLASSTDMLTTRVFITPNTSENPSCTKCSDESEGESRREKLRKFACEICGRAFVRRTHMKQHIQTIHEALRPFSCETCGRSFAQRAHLRKHINSLHKKLREYVCEFCERAFAQSSTLKNHIAAIHGGLRPFECEICDRKFVQLSYLKRHIECLHKKSQAYQCEICGRGFAGVSNMNAHIQIVHKGLRPFECEFCGRKFPRISLMKIHIDRVHKKLREFVCEVCGKAFADRSHMKRHIEAVHEALHPYACEICGRNFGQLTHLRTHISRLHKTPEQPDCEISGEVSSQESDQKKQVDCVSGGFYFLTGICNGRSRPSAFTRSWVLSWIRGRHRCYPLLGLFWRWLTSRHSER